LEIKAAADEKTACPSDKLEQALYLLLRENASNELVERAYDIYTHEFKREVLESFLLVGTTPEEINAIVRVPEAVTEVYAHLFFDTSIFADDLDIINYAYTYKHSKFGRELKRFAVDLGRECLKIRISRGAYNINTTVTQQGIRSTAFLMSQLVRVNKVDSGLANAALRWAQVGLRATEEKDSKEGDAVLEQFRMALETREETTSADQSGISPEDILH
jgi:hypothetical protein